MVVKDPHNLSFSRLEGFFACAFRLGCEKNVFSGIRLPSVPYWLPGGTATHDIATDLLARTLGAGKTLSRTDIDEEVRKAKGKLAAVLTCKLPSKGHDLTRIQQIDWMSPEEKLSISDEEYQKRIKARMWKYINQVSVGIRALADMCAYPSPFRQLHLAKRFGSVVNLTSPRDPSIKIPVWGEIDLLEETREGDFIIKDWKTGSFGHYLSTDLQAHGQMVLYWHAVRELFGKDPLIAFFVSLSVFRSDFEEFGAKVFELDRYKAAAVVDYDTHFPELVREMDDVWAVLTFLAYPKDLLAQAERESWEESSAKGKKFLMRRHLDQKRLIPTIGRHCGMCPARQLCVQHNPQDWEEYRQKQKLGNVVEPLASPLPDDWFDPDHSQVEPLTLSELEEANAHPGQQVHLLKLGKPLQRYSLKAKDWKRLGFFTPVELVAQIKKMHALIPLTPKGEMCPCRKTNRLPEFFLPKAVEFFFEREHHKQVQELEGKTRNGVGKEKVRDLYDSQVVRKLLAHCRVPGCPFPGLCEQEEEAKQEEFTLK